MLPVVYDELKPMASVARGSRPRAHALQPMALVHEAYLGPERGLSTPAIARVFEAGIVDPEIRTRRSSRWS